MLHQLQKKPFGGYCETDEYKHFLEKIKEYLQVYDLILEEFDNYLKEIEPYQRYVDSESKRKRELEISRINMLYESVVEFLPDDIKAFLNDKYSSLDEKSNALFGTDIGMKSYIEFFSEEDEKILNDTSASEHDKNYIYYNRRRYFQKIGSMIEKTVADFETDREFYEYCIQQEHIKKLIPPARLATDINKLRKEAYEEVERDFIYSSQDFIENTKDLSQGTKKAFYILQKENKVCVCGGSDDEGFRPILFYTVRDYACGKLDMIFLHEVGHAIESESNKNGGYRTGFEFFTEKKEKNPYYIQKRKYELLNETITDIFAIEARQALHEQGIYIIEPKELINKDVKDLNSHSVAKQLLTIFLDRYREVIVRARLYGDMDGLYEIIGKENFEELNDVVNRVNSLEGLVPKLENNQNEAPVVVEYHRQLERLERIYANMEAHQARGFANDNSSRDASSTDGETIR